MLPFPFRQLHEGVQKITGFGVTPLNNHFVKVRSDDQFLVSYPKSGNTWIRFILSNLLYPSSVTNFRNIEARLPDVHNINALKVQNAPSPRILKSHFPFKPEYPKVLYVVRNPKSVAISEYHYFQRIGRSSEARNFDQFFQAFLNGPNMEYGSWGEHVNSWLCGMEFKNTLKVVRYEDLRSNPGYYVGEMAKFLGIDATKEEIERAIQNSSFQKMKELEEKSDVRNGANVPFVRKGANQEWKDYLSDKQQSIIHEKFGKAMGKVGYGI